MRTNMITRLLLLAMVLLLTMILPAYADSCALCGKESGNENYLCADCLLGLLEEKDVSGGLEIIGSAPNEDGSGTLVWDDAAANGPYTVYYELLERAPVPFGWTAASGVYGNAVTFTQLVPGTSYVFTVEDASGNKADFIYYAPNVKMGNEVGAKIRIATKMRNARNHMNVPFYVGDIQRPDAREYGLSLKLAYSMLKYTRNYAFSVSVEAPNGFADVVHAGRVVLNYGKSEVPAWLFISLEDFFGQLERYYGGVPAGEYTVMMNFDGVPACSATFEVNEP